jgi:hypothetical protein
VGPETFFIERRIRSRSISDEAVRGVCVHSEEKRDKQVMCVPKRLKRLLADLVMSSGVYEQHAQQHNVSSNSTRLGVVNLERDLGSDLGLLDVVEVDVMRRSVDDGKQEHAVGYLSVEPHGLVERNPSDLWSYDSQDVPAHGHDDDHGVYRQY